LCNSKVTKKQSKYNNYKYTVWRATSLAFREWKEKRGEGAGQREPTKCD